MSNTPDNHPTPPSRKFQRRLLITLAVLVTAVAAFYLEEDWSGKRAWENLKRDVEARGIALDWKELIPAPVPDDQNFFTASSNILLRFKKPTEAESNTLAHCSWLNITYQSNSFPVFDNTKSGPLLVASVTVVRDATAGARSGPNEPVINFEEANAPAKFQRYIQKTTGRFAYGAAGFQFSEFQMTNITPAQLTLRAERPLLVADIEKLVPQNLNTNIGRFQIKTGEVPDTFQVLLADAHATTAADYLKWSDQFQPAFDEIREALKRPYALLPGDYSRPVMIPVPNFVTLRTVAQTLAQRAQCFMLLHQPDQALREMTLIHDICRTLRRIPAGKPITLVESMINVAIAGLYAGMVGDGLRLHAWQEPQLAALQQQLREDDLMPLVAESLTHEQAAVCDHLLNLESPDLQKILWGDKSLRQKLEDPSYVFSKFGPRGWQYRNAVDHVTLMLECIQGFDVSNQLVSVESIDGWQKHRDMMSRWSPYSYFESISLPNLRKVAQRTACNQTDIHEALVACALERYRLTHGEYPETLESLVPQFINALPHDIIGGQPLHYHCTENEKFLLYSVGWNQTDDGGAPTSDDLAKGDWVWKD